MILIVIPGHFSKHPYTSKLNTLLCLKSEHDIYIELLQLHGLISLYTLQGVTNVSSDLKYQALSVLKFCIQFLIFIYNLNLQLYLCLTLKSTVSKLVLKMLYSTNFLQQVHQFFHMACQVIYVSLY